MTETVARDLWSKSFGQIPDRVTRCTTGSCNYVFRVEFQKLSYILRTVSPENAGILRGSLYWLDRLKDLNLPIPKVQRAALDHNPPYVILNFIPGDDLGTVYTTLSEAQKQAIVTNLVAAQAKLALLPAAPGFGHLASYADPEALPTWKAVVHKHLQRSRNRIESNGLFSLDFVQRIQPLLARFDAYFAEIQPLAFFDDITTKNVLVHQGEFSGIIDLDWLCFGDRLYVIALTRMSLLCRDYSLTYIDYWVAQEGLSDFQHQVLDLYTLIFCVDFMSEKGMRFNQASPVKPPAAELEQLKRLYAQLYAACVHNSNSRLP